MAALSRTRAGGWRVKRAELGKKERGREREREGSAKRRKKLTDARKRDAD
jgi:hypothetical protein